jgi:hypothetical protein
VSFSNTIKGEFFDLSFFPQVKRKKIGFGDFRKSTVGFRIIIDDINKFLPILTYIRYLNRHTDINNCLSIVHTYFHTAYADTLKKTLVQSAVLFQMDMSDIHIRYAYL